METGEKQRSFARGGARSVKRFSKELTNECSCAIMRSQGTQKERKEGGQMMIQENFERGEAIPMKGGAIGHCDHCGFAIYSTRDALYIPTTGDRIHKDCWLDYAEEHMFELAETADKNECFDCTNEWHE